MPRFPRLVLFSAPTRKRILPLLHRRKRHYAVNDEVRSPFRLFCRGWRHVHHSVGPLLAIVMAQVPHVVVIVLVIASVVDVRKGLRFQFNKQAEYRIGVVDGVQAFGVGRGKRALVYDAQRFGHVWPLYNKER